MRSGPGEIRGLGDPPSSQRLNWMGSVTSAASIEGGCVCTWGCQPVRAQLQVAQGPEGCATDHIF